MASSTNRRVSVIAHQRAGTEWKSDGNGYREAHLGEVLLKSVGRNVAGVNGLRWSAIGWQTEWYRDRSRLCIRGGFFCLLRRMEVMRCRTKAKTIDELLLA